MTQEFGHAWSEQQSSFRNVPSTAIISIHWKGCISLVYESSWGSPKVGAAGSCYHNPDGLSSLENGWRDG